MSIAMQDNVLKSFFEWRLLIIVTACSGVPSAAAL